MKNEKNKKSKENNEMNIKDQVLKDLNVEKREERRNDVKRNEEFKDRRSGDDRRNNNLIGGRRKTDLTEKDAKEFEKIISSDDGKKALDNLSKVGYKNLNDEAKKIEIKRTIGFHKLNSKRLATLVFLVLLTTAIISITYIFVNKRSRMEKESARQVNIIKQKLDKQRQNEVDSATLENLNKALKKSNKK